MRFGLGILDWRKNLFLAQLFLQVGRLAGYRPKVPPHLPKDAGQLNSIVARRPPRREFGISRARVRRFATYGVGSA